MTARRRRGFVASWAKEMAATLAWIVLLGGLAFGALAFIEVPGFGSPWQWMTTRPFTKELVAESQAIGNELVAALERHRAAEGAYPDDLSDLEPRFVDDVRLPTAGCREWGYRLEGDGFVLKFYRPGDYPVSYYESARAGWVVDD